MRMRTLRFPTYEFKIINRNNKPYIFDIIRKQYVALLPEEWVRQHLNYYLIFEKQFPKGLMKVEQYIKVNQQKRFTDLTVFNRSGKPLLIAECKSYKTPLTTYTFEQISAYGKVLESPYFVVTNGLHHFVYHINWGKRQFSFLNDVPTFNDIGN